APRPPRTGTRGWHAFRPEPSVERPLVGSDHPHQPYMAEKLSSGREAGSFKRLEAARHRPRRPHQMGKAKAHRCFSTPRISSSITSRGTNHSEGSRGNSRVAPTTDSLAGGAPIAPASPSP